MLDGSLTSVSDWEFFLPVYDVHLLLPTLCCIMKWNDFSWKMMTNEVSLTPTSGSCMNIKRPRDWIITSWARPSQNNTSVLVFRLNDQLHSTQFVFVFIFSENLLCWDSNWIRVCSFVYFSSSLTCSIEIVKSAVELSSASFECNCATSSFLHLNWLILIHCDAKIFLYFFITKNR